EREVANEGLRVERCAAPSDNLIAFAVKDCTGRVRGMLALEMNAMEWDLPERLLARVRCASGSPEPDSTGGGVQRELHCESHRSTVVELPWPDFMGRRVLLAIRCERQDLRPVRGEG